MRLGVFQAACGGCTVGERFDRLSAALDAHDLDLVVCPELFASGYLIDGHHRDLAERADGPSFRAMGRLARQHGCAIAYGYPEAEGDKIYNSAALVGGDGTRLANHRKALPSPHSFEETSFANGAPAPLAMLGGLRIAMAICYEIEFPETARRAALAGADLLLVPTALVDSWPSVAERMVPTRAFENGLWLAYANHGGSEGGKRYLGGSRIVAPDGSEPAVAGAGEDLIAAEIDADAVQAARARLPYLRDCAFI